MQLNPFPRLFGRREPPAVKLLAVTPPRTGERTLVAVENLLGSIALPEPFSLEIAGDADGVSVLTRCGERSLARQQLEAYYPQARIAELTEDEDPLRLEEGERAWSRRLRVEGPEFLPLRTFEDDDTLDAGSDPLISVVGALSGLERGERLVTRLRLRSLGPDWSKAHLQKALSPPQPVAAPPSSSGGQARANPAEFMPFVFLAVAGAIAFQGWRWWQAGEWWKTALLGLGIAAVLGAGGWALARWNRKRYAVHDNRLMKEKASRTAFEAELELTAILSEHGSEDRARELLDGVASAYAHYDNVAGARFKAGKVREAVPDRTLAPPRRGLLRSREVLDVRELAGLWHPPGARDELPLVERSGAKVLLPAGRGTGAGALVGETTAGKRREIRFSGDLLRRHHLYVARTRMGKSTLMQHIITHKLMEKAAGRDGDAIIVIDPHADLVSDLLERVPPELADRVRLIDLADEQRAPGINLLDARVFRDRDRTADAVVRVAKGLWEQWGPRMQSILEYTVKSLHEANQRREPEEQYTILDGLRLLSNREFRRTVLRQVRDPHLLAWWAGPFASWTGNYRADALAPVLTRLAYYAGSKRARAILGQRRSTVDLRQLIAEGGVLFVSTSQAAAGKEVSALVGASILNLVDAVIREQGALPPDERRGALVVVDEMQAMPGVDYESMLSELGKFGGSFVLATQSLSRLSELSPTLQDTLLANAGCLAVFQVAAADARELVWELSKERLSEEDITSLPVHHAYVRATVGGERQPPFSMEVLKPAPGDPAVAASIREGTAAYTTPMAELESEDQALLAEFQEGLEEIDAEAAKQQDGAAPPQAKGKKKRPRTRKRRGPEAA